MNKKLIIYVVVALIVGGVVGTLYGKSTTDFVGTALNCATNTTCLPSLELTGNIDTSTPSLQIDTGGMSVTGATTLGSTTVSSLKVGSSATQFSTILAGSCNLLGNASIAASSTAGVDCAATGVLVDDKVFFALATTSPFTNYGGLMVVGANASSTSGFITFSVQNNTGAAIVPSSVALFGSSTNYYILR